MIVDVNALLRNKSFLLCKLTDISYRKKRKENILLKFLNKWEIDNQHQDLIGILLEIRLQEMCISLERMPSSLGATLVCK